MYPGWLPPDKHASIGPAPGQCCILNRPDAGKTFWPGIVCTAAWYWPNAGISLYAVVRPVYIKQYWLYTGKTASAQYRPRTLQYRPDAGPMLYAELARCWQSILARH